MIVICEREETAHFVLLAFVHQTNRPGASVVQSATYTITTGDLEFGVIEAAGLLEHQRAIPAGVHILDRQAVTG